MLFFSIFSRHTCYLQYFVFSLLTDFIFFTCFQDKEIYRWPIKESIKAMLAWEWTVEKARDGEGEAEKKAATRKISQTAQVKEKAFLMSLNVVIEHKRLKDTTINLVKLMMA